MTQPNERRQRDRGRIGNGGSDQAGLGFFVIGKDCDRNKGTFTEVVEDDRIFPFSIVFATVTENLDGEPHHGSARWTVHDVSPRSGAVDVAISHNHPRDLPFLLNLWVINGYL